MTGPGGSYDIKSDNFFTGTVVGNGGSGNHSVNFFTSQSPLNAAANASVTVLIGGTFNGLAMSWYDAATNALKSTSAITSGIVGLTTTFTNASPSQNLVFSWTGSTKGVGFDFDVAAAPLPAAFMMLLTAIGGLGLAGWRRRRTSA
ncbi:VPLPA-CTERM sorting domain-containing protein (plasmid) [Roseobacteraceae bacterium NS-SX3]